MTEPYNTNLAAEFYVMSALYRLGADAALSLGNKKAVDITVVRGEGQAVTIDVKNRTVISRAAVRSEGARFRDAWSLVLGNEADAEPEATPDDV